MAAVCYQPMQWIKKNIYLISFVLILFLAVFLRLFALDQTPPLMQFDEGSFGYNAYSLLKTGQDEYGNLLPFAIRAFDDWRPPLYTYTLSALFAVVGTNDVVVRFPSALSGIGTVLLLYLLVRDFIGKKYALPAMFLCAINPGLILASRTAYDANYALFYTLLCLYAFVKAVEKKKVRYLSQTIVFGVFSMLAYQSPKSFIPLTLSGGLILWYRNVFNILKSKKNLIIIIFISLLSVIPLLLSLSTKGSLNRFYTISIFEQEQLVKIPIIRTIFNNHNHLSFMNPLVNRRVMYFQETAKLYLDNFNPAFLFSYKIEPSVHYIVNFGAFHLVDLILVIVGIFGAYTLVERKKFLFLLIWILATPTSSMFLSTAPNITRIYPIIPVLLIFASIGWVTVWERIKLPLVMLYGISIIYLLYSLFYLNPLETPKYWQGNFRTWVEKAWSIKRNYDHIYVSVNLERAYILFLWYTKYDPNAYHARGTTRGGDGMRPTDSFDRFTFTYLTPQTFSTKGNILFVGLKNDFPKGSKPTYTLDCNTIKVEECVWFVESASLPSLPSTKQQ